MVRTRAVVLPVVLVACFAAGCSRSPEAYVASGDKYRSEGKLREAVVEYRKAIQKAPKNGEAHWGLGLAYERLGNRPGAVAEFIRAGDALPGNRQVQIKAGQSLLIARRFQEARSKGEQLLIKKPKDLEALLLVANALAGLKEMDAAVKRVEEAITLDPSRVESYANLAALELVMGDPAKAETAFRSAMAVSPRSVEARVGLASLYWAGGRLAEAEKLLEETVRMAPADALANRTLAGFYLATNRAADAEAPLKAVVAADQTLVAPRLALADYYLMTTRGEDGVRMLEALVKQKDGYAPATLRLARYEYNNGKRPSAHSRLDTLMAADPKNAEAVLTKAELLLRDGRLDEALERAQAAARLAPRVARTHYAVGTLYEMKKAPEQAIKAYQEALKQSPRFAAASLHLARLYLLSGQLQQAVQAADEAVANQPQNGEAHELLARALMARGDSTRVDAEMQLLLRQPAPPARVHSLAGLVAVSRGNPAAARTSFERALKEDPNDHDALGGLTAIDIAAGRKAEARRRLEDRMKAASSNAVMLQLGARMYEALGLPAEAETAWQKLLEVDGGNIEAYGALGRLYYAQNKLALARAKFEQAATSRPRAVGPHTMVAFLLEMEGRKAEAQKRYQKVLEVDPRAPVAANNLAWLYCENGGNIDVALQLAQVAKAGLPDAPEVNDTLGWIYYRKNQPALAVRPLQEAVARQANSATYRYHLGLAYAKTGDKAKAREALAAALKLDPAFAAAADARKLLSTM